MSSKDFATTEAERRAAEQRCKEWLAALTVGAQGCPTCGNTDAATLRRGMELYGEDDRVVSCLRCLGDAFRLPLDGDAVGQRRRAFEVETAARTWRPVIADSAATPPGVEVAQGGGAVAPPVQRPSMAQQIRELVGLPVDCSLTYTAGLGWMHDASGTRIGRNLPTIRAAIGGYTATPSGYMLTDGSMVDATQTSERDIMAAREGIARVRLVVCGEQRVQRPAVAP